VKLRLLAPAVQSLAQGRPSKCPRCQHPYLARHGISRNPITDTKLHTVQVVRYRCSGCGTCGLPPLSGRGKPGPPDAA